MSRRFIGVVVLNFIDPALALSFYGLACSAFALGVAYAPGKGGVGCLFGLFFFESICYPVSALFCVLHGSETEQSLQVIFTIATKNLGRYTKRGSGLIVMVRRVHTGGFYT